VAQWLQPVVQFIGDREYLARCRASSVAGVQTLEAHLVLVLLNAAFDLGPHHHHLRAGAGTEGVLLRALVRCTSRPYSLK